MLCVDKILNYIDRKDYGESSRMKENIGKGWIFSDFDLSYDREGAVK